MKDNTYNGWTNRETWLVNVWFNPECKQDVESAREHIEEDVSDLPDYLKDFIDIGCINWSELIEHFEEEDDDTADDTTENEDETTRDYI